jgi:hypothetical protein
MASAPNFKARVFTRDELEEMGVPHECGGDEGTAEELHCEIYDTTRWSNVYEFVFRAPDDGKAYRVYYDWPATEMQEGGVDLWDYENRIKAVEVEQVQVVTTEWKPVKEES